MSFTELLISDIFAMKIHLYHDGYIGISKKHVVVQGHPYQKASGKVKSPSQPPAPESRTGSVA